MSLVYIIFSLSLSNWVIFFQSLISFTNAVCHRFNIFLRKWLNMMHVCSALWVLMVWHFSTRTSVATVLSTYPCVFIYMYIYDLIENYRFERQKWCTKTIIKSIVVQRFFYLNVNYVYLFAFKVLVFWIKGNRLHWFCLKMFLFSYFIPMLSVSLSCQNTKILNLNAVFRIVTLFVPFELLFCYWFMH